MNLWKDRFWKPMNLLEIKKPFNAKDYIYELKFDGIRAIIFVSPKCFYIMSKNNKDLTNVYPELKSIQKIVKKKVIFDGEIVALDKGLPSFSKLLKPEKNKEDIFFVAFDILYEDKNLIDMPLLKRKEILAKYPNTEVFWKIKYITNEGIKLFKIVKKLNLEGIVAKNLNSTYHPNKRTNDFITIKSRQREQFIIGGYIEKNKCILLLLGEYKKKKLQYVGKVVMNKKHPLYQKIKNAKRTNSKFINYNKEGIFIKPTYTCYVSYLTRTKENYLWHPSFQSYSGDNY